MGKGSMSEQPVAVEAADTDTVKGKRKAAYDKGPKLRMATKGTHAQTPKTEAEGKATFTPVAGRVCAHCGTSVSGAPFPRLLEPHAPQGTDDGQWARCQTTPLWRNGPLGPKTLCNACGVRDGRRQSKGWGGTGPAAQRARKVAATGSKVAAAAGSKQAAAAAAAVAAAAGAAAAAGRGYGSSTNSHAPHRAGARARPARVPTVMPTVKKRGVAATSATAFDWTGALPAAMLPGATPVWAVLGRDTSRWPGVRMCVVLRTCVSDDVVPGVVPTAITQSTCPPLLRIMPVCSHTLAAVESSTAAEANVWWAPTEAEREVKREGSGNSRTHLAATTAPVWGLQLADAPSKGALLALLRSAADTNDTNHVVVHTVPAVARPWLPGATPSRELDAADHAWLATSGVALSVTQTVLLFESFETAVADTAVAGGSDAIHAALTASAVLTALLGPVPPAAAVEVALTHWRGRRTTGRRTGAGSGASSPHRTDSRTDSSSSNVTATAKRGGRKPGHAATKLRKVGADTNNGAVVKNADDELQAAGEAAETQAGLLYTLGTGGHDVERMPSAENLLNPLDRCTPMGSMYLLEPQSMESESMGFMGFHSSPEESSLLSGMVPLWEEHSGAHLLDGAESLL
jgi:hypothetical protein